MGVDRLEDFGIRHRIARHNSVLDVADVIFFKVASEWLL
jgi:hypothetical protein